MRLDLAGEYRCGQSGVVGEPIEVSVQASPGENQDWGALARRCEQLGCRALLVGDHPGVGASPFVALAAAVAATSRLRLGSYVLNAGIRHPLLIASDVATLDVVSGGRAEVGLGAGHTPAEWEMTGQRRPAPAERVEQLTATAAAVRSLLDGCTVPAADLHALTDVELQGPRPVQQRVPLLIGGANPELLGWGGAHADAVGLSGLGRTLSDGHSHTVSWSPSRVEAHVELIRDGARRAHTSPPPIEALVQQVTITDDREAVARSLTERLNTRVADLLAVPYLWIGTPAEIAEQLRAARDRWGIRRWVIRDSALEDLPQILAAL